MSFVEIITLSPDDWQQYKQIRLEALQTEPIAFATTYEEAQLYSDQDWKEKLASTGSRLLFARVDGKIAGTMVIHLRGQKVAPGTAMITGVYVNSAYRGQGIGKKTPASCTFRSRT